MADAQFRLSPKMIAGAGLILVLAAFAFSRYFRGDENTTPPSPAYEAMMADKASEGYRAPPARGTGAPGAGSSRLSGAADSAEEETQEEQGVDSKKRKNRKKKARKESKKDEYGNYRFEDGRIDHNKMPPMGG